MSEKTIGIEEKKVLTAFNSIGGNTTPKAVAEVSGLDSKIVTKAIKSLKENGLIDSPVRCRYCITEAGKNNL